MAIEINGSSTKTNNNSTNNANSASANSKKQVNQAAKKPFECLRCAQSFDNYKNLSQHHWCIRDEYIPVLSELANANPDSVEGSQQSEQSGVVTTPSPSISIVGDHLSDVNLS